jgi:hypothetical protein
VLTTGPGGTEGIDFQIARIDFWQFRLWHRWHHRHRAGRGMDTALGFGFRHALHAVTARFKLQLAVNAVTRHFGNHLFVTAVFTHVFAHDLNPPAASFSVTAIHTEQIASKNGRFVATGSGAYFQETIAFIVRILWQQQHLQLLFQLFRRRFGLFQLFLRHFTHFRIVQHHFCRGKIVLHLTPFQKTTADISQLRIFPRQATEPILIGNNTGIAEQRLNFFMALL